MYNRTFNGGNESNDTATCCGCGKQIKDLNEAAQTRQSTSVDCISCGARNHISFHWSLSIVAKPMTRLSVPEELNW